MSEHMLRSGTRSRLRYGLTLLFITVLAGPIGAQEHDADYERPIAGEGKLSLASVVDSVLEADPGIRVSRNRTLQAREQYNLALSGTRPRADLEIRPYSYDQRRIPGMPGALEQTVHEVGAGLRVRQPLPTSGVLSAGLDYSVRRVNPESGSDRWEQIPELTFGWNQPLLAGDELIGTRVFRAGLRDAEISFVRAEVLHKATRNDAILDVLELYVATGNLRRSRDLLEITIDLLRSQLESAELDRQQGLISDTALLSLQVALNDRREALFSTQLQLVQIEQQLARAIGVRTVSEADLEEIPEIPPVTAVGDLRTAISENPRLRAGDLTVEQAEQRLIMGDAADRPTLSLFARALPVYPEPREETDSLSGSFSDLIGSDAGLEFTAGVSVTIPLLTARQREYRSRIDDLTRLNAEVDRDDTEKLLANAMRTLLTSRRFLQERLELLKTDVDYEERRVRNEQTLLDAGVTTTLRVREVELDLHARRNEQNRVRAELFLNSLEILSLLGEDLAVVMRDR